MQSTTLQGGEELKSTFPSEMETQSLEFALLVSGFALAHYFLTMASFHPVTHNLCHCMWEARDLIFYYDFTGGS